MKILRKIPLGSGACSIYLLISIILQLSNKSIVSPVPRFIYLFVSILIYTLIVIIFLKDNSTYCKNTKEPFIPMVLVYSLSVAAFTYLIVHSLNGLVDLFNQ